MSFLVWFSVILFLCTSTRAHCPQFYDDGINWASAHCVYSGLKCGEDIARKSGSCKPHSETQSLKCMRSACAYCKCHNTLTLCDSTMYKNICVGDKPVPTRKPRNLWRPNRSGWHPNSDAWNALVARSPFPNKTCVSIPGNDVMNATLPWRSITANRRCWIWNVTDVINGPWPAKPMCYFFRVKATAAYKYSVLIPSREVAEIQGVHSFYPKLRFIFYNALNDVIGIRNFVGGTHISPILRANTPYKVCVFPTESSFSFCGMHFWRGELNQSAILEFGVEEAVPSTPEI